QDYDARWQLLCAAFEVDTTQQMQRLAADALSKVYRAYSFEFDSEGRVRSHDISTLDPGSEDERVAGWGGLTAFSSRFGEVVREAANEAVSRKSQQPEDSP
ncbi:MAG: hypothetical protein RBU37_23495, partial [Myxococcota bacterium]|nr:hypothetical protein [Myxococcota bacterium]